MVILRGSSGKHKEAPRKQGKTIRLIVCLPGVLHVQHTFHARERAVLTWSSFNVAPVAAFRATLRKEHCMLVRHGRSEEHGWCS